MQKRLAVLLSSLTALTCIIFAIGGAFAQEKTKLPIIMYHSVVEDESRAGKYVLSARQFENDVKYLYENGYNAVDFSDLLKYIEGGELPVKPVMITFDDGFINNVDICGPILKKYSMKAVISVVGVYAQAEEECTWKRSDNYSYLKWEEIKGASQGNVFEIQNHSYNMHGGNGRQGAKKKDEEREEAFIRSIEDDMLKMQGLLTDKCGVTPVCFTYPFGYFNKCTERAVKKCGFRASMTCYEKINEITRDKQSLYALGRYNRPADKDTAEFFKNIICRAEDTQQNT